MAPRLLTAALLAMAVGAPSPVRAQPASPPAPLDSLDRYIERTRAAWGIPGVAVAVVRGDSVIWSRGFGVRRLGGAAPVTPNTLFAIGSSSKSFTAALLGFLVDEGRLHWDDRVTSRLPGFELADPATTAAVTIRDLLSHRTGVVGDNLVFWGSGLSRAEVLRRARFIRIAAPLRTRYEYQNVMFLAAGEIIPAVTGRSWDDELRRRIFRPLGMSRSEPGVRQLGSRSDVASPHGFVDGALRPIPWLDLDNAGPAGSIVSSALDMTRYVRWHLHDGVFAGTRLLADSTMREMHGRQMAIPKDAFYGALMPDAPEIHYGLGWMSHDYHGHRIVEHGGQTDGMHGTVAMMPDQGIGVVVLTNSVRFGYPAAIAYRVFDAFLGRPPQDWSARIGELLKSNGEPGSGRPEPPADPARPTIPLQRLAGRYHHQLYGDAVITVTGGAARLTLLGRTVPLRHWTGDEYRPGWRPSDAMIRGMMPIATFEAGSAERPIRLRFGEVATFERAPPR